MKKLKISIFNKQPAPTPRRRLSDGASPAQRHLDRDFTSTKQATFRRNSTITGSRSSQVRSASELDGQLQSPRTMTHHLRRRQRSLSALFAGSMLVVVALAVFMYQFTASTTTSVYGQIGVADTSQEARYQQAVQQYLNRRPLDRLRVLLDKSALASYMQQSGYAEISSIESVTPDGFGASHLKIKVREPVASWTTNGTKRYVDRSGTIFTQNYFAEPTVKIVDQSHVDLEDSSGNVTSSRFLTFVGQAVGQLRDSQLDIREVIIPPTGTRQVEFALSNNDRIRMTVDRRAGEQVEDAVRAVRYLTTERQSISYIDVRVSGQAYYR